jgi:hypothetical protein
VQVWDVVSDLLVNYSPRTSVPVTAGNCFSFHSASFISCALAQAERRRACNGSKRIHTQHTNTHTNTHTHTHTHTQTHTHIPDNINQDQQEERIDTNCISLKKNPPVQEDDLHVEQLKLHLRTARQLQEVAGVQITFFIGTKVLALLVKKSTVADAELAELEKKELLERLQAKEEVRQFEIQAGLDFSKFHTHTHIFTHAYTSVNRTGFLHSNSSCTQRFVR